MGMGISWGRVVGASVGALVGALALGLAAPPAGAQSAGFQPCDAGQEQADAFVTEGFQVWICRSGDGSLSFRGLAGGGDPVVLPATADGEGGYDARDGAALYHADPQYVRVTDGAGTVVVEQQVTARPAAVTTDRAGTGSTEGPLEGTSGWVVGLVALGLVMIYPLPVIAIFAKGAAPNAKAFVVVCTFIPCLWWAGAITAAIVPGEHAT
jgi:hypothetical protein